MLTEALVYIGVLFLLLGVGYAALHRCIDSSTLLRRNAEDISRTLHIGERWRADVRASGRNVRLLNTAEGQLLHLGSAGQQVDYRFANNTVQRRRNAGPWVTVLDQVKSSAMQSDSRDPVVAWRWELELQPRAKGRTVANRIRPLFTFLTVPQPASKP